MFLTHLENNNKLDSGTKTVFPLGLIRRQLPLYSAHFGLEHRKAEVREADHVNGSFRCPVTFIRKVFCP